MTPKMLRNAGLASITALSLALVACGGSSSSQPPAPVQLKPTNVMGTANPTNNGVVGHVQYFTLSANDPDGDASAITFTATASDAGTCTVTNNLLAYTPKTAGVNSITVTAKDAQGLTATGAVPVVVTANTANGAITIQPTISVGAGFVQAPISLGNAVDAEKDPVTYSLTSTYSWITLDANKKNLQIDTTGIAAGNYKVTITATDNVAAPSTGTTSQDVTVVVGALPAGKVDSYPNPLTFITRDVPFSYQLAASSPLTGDAIVKWEVDGGTPGAAAPKNAAITTAGLFSWLPDNTFPLGQQVVFGLKATFKSGVVAYQVVQLTPQGANSAPTWSAAAEAVPVASIAKLNGVATTKLTWALPAIVLSSADRALTYEVATAALPTDVDLIHNDQVTFTVKAVQIGGTNAVNNPDVKDTLIPGVTYTAGTFNAAGTYTAGKLTIPAPAGAVKDAKGNVLGCAETAAPAAATNLYVTVEAKDLAGKTATCVFQLPVRKNAAPVVDNQTKGGASITSPDSLITALPIPGIVNVQPAEGATSRWTLGSAIAVPAVKMINDAADALEGVAMTATIGGEEVTTRFTLTPNAAGTSYVVESPEFTALDARKAYTFTLVATDVYGYKSKPVTFTGSINGTLHATQAQTWLGFGVANPMPNDFNVATATVNPYHPSGVNAGFFHEDPTAPQGKASGNIYNIIPEANSGLHFNSVPAGVFYLQTNVVKDTPFATPNTWVYSDASAVTLDNTSATRLAALAATSHASYTATKTTAPAPLSAYFGRAANPNATTDFMQLVNTNLGISHNFDLGKGGLMATPTFGAAFATGAVTLPGANTTAAVLSNNNDDLAITVDWAALGFRALTGMGAKADKSDAPVFGMMTYAQLDGDAYGPVDTWKMTRAYAPTPFNQLATGATTVAKGDFASLALDKNVPLAIDRAAFIDQADALNTGNVVTTKDQLKVYAYPTATTYGPVQPSAPVVFATQVFNAASTKNVDLGTVKHALLPNTEAVYEYTYNFDQTAQAVLGTTQTTGVLPASFSLITNVAPTAAIAPTIAPVTDVQVTAGIDPTDKTTIWENGMVDTGTDLDPVTPGVQGAAAAAAGDKKQIALKWTAIANVSGYVIEAYNVNAAATNLATAVPAATIYTAKNEVMLPTTMLPVANKYIFRIRVVSMPGVDFNVTPFKKAFPMATAESWTGVIQF